ncbi:hypothetical protein L486_05554 [Kwoniella mangroviensis CBS 10435]|uniref:Aminoglycoside phosphotransferase domain-containing protein n=1 Tax=Kwoniella mangroviensis CBS 10435 TaxID=1331196 RepID=A0A1B9IMV1_9TREE|nr:hypothetical protein L486_05554 [Kwoniella mangroviensis CBS 10435]
MPAELLALPNNAGMLRTTLRDDTVLSDVATHKKDLINVAQRLRPEHTCHLILPEDSEQFFQQCRGAGFNVHFTLKWDDDVKWLIRVRQDRGHRIPHEVREADIKSEVATLQRLRAGGISVPEAWLPGYLDDSKDGMPTISPFPFDYFFYTFLQGRPWPIQKTPFYPMRLPEEDIKKYIEAYALHQIKMSHFVLPLNQIRCLQMNKSGEEVGPIITRETFQKPEPPYLLGPFSTQKERYLSHIDITLDYILMGAVGESGPIDSYLWHLEMRELVEHSKILARPITEVYIKHDDEKGDQLLWDDHGKVCGVLDWQWAYTTTKAEAFAAPPLLYESINLFSGENSMTEEENFLIGCYRKYGRPDLGDCVEKGRLYQRLSFIGHWYDFYKKIGFREPFEPDLPSDFHPPLDDVDWQERAKVDQRADDTRLDDGGKEEVAMRAGCDEIANMVFDHIVQQADTSKEGCNTND